MTTTRAARSPHDEASTRYLCAGAHIDRTFAGDIVKGVIRQPHRAVGPANGIDVPLVLQHCIAAYRRRLLRDAGLLTVGVALLAAYFNGWGRMVLALLVVAWAIVLLELCVVRVEVLSARMNPRTPRLRLPEDQALKMRLDEIARAQSTNVTVYSGYDPFVGSGLDASSWSVAVDLDKGKEEFGKRRTPKAVELRALRERVTTTVVDSRIEGLAVEDVLHVSGDVVHDSATEVGEHGDVPILPGGPLTRPVGRLDPGVVRRFGDLASERWRHYQRIQITAWGGEVVMSVFVRFSVVGSRLYAEANYRVLMPVKHEWRRVDELTRVPTGAQILDLLGHAGWSTLPALILAGPRLAGEAWRRWVQEPFQDRRERTALADGAVVDYGTLLTVRQRGGARTSSRHFQRLDWEMWTKLLDRAILDTLVAVLDENDVDTSDLVDRQTALLNHGVLVTAGGSFQAQSVATSGGKVVTGAAQKAAAAVRRA
jgi:hypothetical protein